jgi:hypothetical protein
MSTIILGFVKTTKRKGRTESDPGELFLVEDFPELQHKLQRQLQVGFRFLTLVNLDISEDHLKLIPKVVQAQLEFFVHVNDGSHLEDEARTHGAVGG